MNADFSLNYIEKKSGNLFKSFWYLIHGFDEYMAFDWTSQKT